MPATIIVTFSTMNWMITSYWPLKLIIKLSPELNYWYSDVSFISIHCQTHLVAFSVVEWRTVPHLTTAKLLRESGHCDFHGVTTTLKLVCWITEGFTECKALFCFMELTLVSPSSVSALLSLAAITKFNSIFNFAWSINSNIKCCCRLEIMWALSCWRQTFILHPASAKGHSTGDTGCDDSLCPFVWSFWIHICWDSLSVSQGIWLGDWKSHSHQI